MLGLYCVFCLLIPTAHLLSLHAEHRRTIEQVKAYLQDYDIAAQLSEKTNWLENSNKIGFGYNILAGSPICYTGKCQMNEFTRSIFKLNYTSATPGSCTNKLVPQNVDIDCLPSTSLQIDSESIDTVEHLSKSIYSKVQVSAGVTVKGVGFSYTHSKETRNVLDNIVKESKTAIVSCVLC